MTDERLAHIKEQTANRRRFMAQLGRTRHIAPDHSITHLEELAAEVDRLKAACEKMKDAWILQEWRRGNVKVQRIEPAEEPIQ